MSQMHGKSFEIQLKKAFAGAAENACSPTAIFDIDGCFDERGIPTSIKTTGSQIVCMADASRFFALKETIRLLVLTYKQIEDWKVPHTLDEFIISCNEHKLLCGSIPVDEVKAFHEGLKKFKRGLHAEARIWADKQESLIAERYTSKVKLNRKIDSKSQRRLQMSVNIEVLRQVCQSQIKIHAIEEIITYRQTKIQKIQSPKRKIKNEQ
jgi:hypothetical protein